MDQFVCLGDCLGETYHVEFQIPGEKKWHSAWDTFKNKKDAKEWIKGSKESLRAEGNPIGKYRVVEGPATEKPPSFYQSTFLVPHRVQNISFWALLATLGVYFISKDEAIKHGAVVGGTGLAMLTVATMMPGRGYLETT
jgi:hypothetical protein